MPGSVFEDIDDFYRFIHPEDIELPINKPLQNAFIRLIRPHKLQSSLYK